MAVKNTKPYSTPKRTTKKLNVDKKKNSKKKDLDVTTRIRVDEVRINDAESLDTSFLEGRSKKRVNKNTKKVKNKILNDSDKNIDIINIIKIVIYLVFSITVVILFVLFIKNNMSSINNNKNTEKDKDEITLKKDDDSKVIVDRNYLFVGDFYTESFDFDDFDLDYHYIKSSNNKLTTEMLLSDIENMVYVYNPSIVFINVGFNDLDSGKKIDETIDDLDDIITSIKNNRTYANIYIQSIYPINTKAKDYDSDLIDNINNDIIVKFNKRLLALTKSKKVNYLDVYSMLEKNGELDLDYTTDGVNLNEDGYKQVFKVINKVID